MYIAEFFFKIDTRQACELTQLHVENVDGLAFRELEWFCHQRIFCSGCIFAFANQLDDLINDIECLDAAFKNVATIFCLVETELCATCNHFKLVTHVTVQRISQVDRARNTINKSNHVHREAGLQRCHLVQVVENDICVRITLQQNGEACLSAGRTVVHVGDAFKFAAVDEFLNTCSD